ncbi:hypothetical protein [Tropicibacter oceani]|uniref:Uncharacterized protein n=1 Tax=Tropicibacter oceani TaxID=3058420 RepID=A0ABY8QDL3_9RHOB|nr:hypothetical protein [Tropicibacter oceani]WGW02589.1 hypothetical protein QF118_11620 [Tropicibacter oceani]
MMAMTGGDGLTIEICADGAVKTVSIGADGTPVDPGAECHDCLACCQSPDAVAPARVAADPDLAARAVPAGFALRHDPFVRNPVTRPLPRGPPAIADLHTTAPEMIRTQRNGISLAMRGNGRPDLKDAVA